MSGMACHCMWRALAPRAGTRSRHAGSAVPCTTERDLIAQLRMPSLPHMFQGGSKRHLASGAVHPRLAPKGKPRAAHPSCRMSPGRCRCEGVLRMGRCSQACRWPEGLGRRALRARRAAAASRARADMCQQLWRGVARVVGVMALALLRAREAEPLADGVAHEAAPLADVGVRRGVGRSLVACLLERNGADLDQDSDILA